MTLQIALHCQHLLNSAKVQEGLHLPGPAGALQRAQAAGLRMPQMPELQLHTQTALTCSQQQLQQEMHPDFVSPAWRSAMEAIDLLCFSGMLRLHQICWHLSKPAMCNFCYIGNRRDVTPATIPCAKGEAMPDILQVAQGDVSPLLSS